MYLTVPEVREEPLPEEIAAALAELKKLEKAECRVPCECCGHEHGVTWQSARTAYHFDPQEGGKCPVAKCDGVLEFSRFSPCTCAVSPMPPCGSCTGSFLACTTCGEHADDHDPNRDVALCLECAVEHHEHWDSMWDDYYQGRL